jgi:hypothetical protein
MNVNHAKSELQKLDEQKAAARNAGRWSEVLDIMASLGYSTLAELRDMHDPVCIAQEDYGAYLRSPLWRRIRNRVLKRDHRECQRHGCDRKANEVHHRSYDDDVMKGNDDSKLVSLCRSCHEYITYDENGIRRPLEEQDRLLQDVPDRTILPAIEIIRGQVHGEKVKAAWAPGPGFSEKQLSQWKEKVKKMGAQYVKTGPRNYWPI